MNIPNALKLLISKPFPAATDKQLRKYTDKVISLRPDPELRHFLETISDNIGGMSVSALCIALLEAYRVADIKSQDTSTAPQLSMIQRSSHRVRELFEQHDYNVFEAIEILAKYDVNLPDFLDDIRLADKLCKQGFNELSDAFAVSRDWLTGASDNVRSILDFDSNVRGLIQETQEMMEQRRLDFFIPICSSDVLDGSKIIYSGQNKPTVDVGIVLIERPKEGFKHRNIKVYGNTYFDCERTRIQFKAAMLQAYRIVGPGTFQGRGLKQGVMDDIYRNETIRLEDIIRLSHFWDPECYFNKPTGQSKAQETHENSAVIEKAESLFSSFKEYAAKLD